MVEPPTAICLVFEWNITADDNRNTTVEGLPRGEASGLDRTGRFAGSILGLHLETDYEVRVTLRRAIKWLATG